MVVGLATIYLQSVPITTDVVSFESRSLCDKVCQWLATSLWFSMGPPVSSTNKTDRHDITQILLKVALNTIKQTNKHFFPCLIFLNEVKVLAIIFIQ